ncbi:MAG: hypothetical protein B1H07_01630 [Campylobacteraceae bacterium 4484_166]|nr:MAG: hypothetical protein B1H07_01630 [Campylobacteraceae bacterium 4484_166]
MFHEYRDIVTKLKQEDKHFKKVFEEHNDIHDQIEKYETGGNSHIDPLEIERLKKLKLKLKDEAYAMIIDHKNK